MKPSRSADNSSGSVSPPLLLADYLPHRLAVTTKSVSDFLQRRHAEAFGLTMAEWRIVAVVGRLTTLSPSAVGEWTGMDKVKVSRSSASLVSRGLLKQSNDPSDGRGRLLRLTRKGLSVYNALVPLAYELEEKLAQGLTNNEWKVLGRALEKLELHVKQLDGEDKAQD